MRFSIIIGGVKKVVDVEPIDDRRFKVNVDGKDYEVSVEGLEGLARASAGGAQISAYDFEDHLPLPAFSEGTLAEHRPAERAAREEVIEAPQATKEAQIGEVMAKPEGVESLEVKSPLPGVISLIEVKEGSRVKRGDVLLFIESMKMLNEIVAPKNGIVKRIVKGPGEQINVGDPLVELVVEGE